MNKCKNCGRDSVYVDDDDMLCDSCFDYVHGHSSYNPAERNPTLEAVQALLDDDEKTEAIESSLDEWFGENLDW